MRKIITCRACGEEKPQEGKGLCRTCYARWRYHGFQGDGPPPPGPRGFRTHGKWRTRVYIAWQSMRQRCNNPRCYAYTNYGGRGITVCERWSSFENFYADMGDPPPGTSLDRINNGGNYEPGNCRWANHSQQSYNTRQRKGKTSRYLGVGWDSQTGKWRAWYGGRHLGRFTDEEEAVAAVAEFIASR